jgi:hypothetical protein
MIGLFDGGSYDVNLAVILKLKEGRKVNHFLYKKTMFANPFR